MADSHVVLRWTGEGDRFEGEAPGGGSITLDSDGKAGPSPMTALLLSLAGCMAIDIRMILEKGRVPLDGLEVEIEGDRAAEPPRRFTGLHLTIRVRGPAEEHEARIARAVDLSRDKYCSVFHSLRTDLDVEIVVERS
jgi:putative redox protein